ncbi:MAG: tRNA epoxyqueuosine(34) reductase QueG [Elusimicrobia bacterium]|nr:tRNA epoxyqueuosine(34) reductase QueG [Elusimicrobiota bacterium]
MGVAAAAPPQAAEGGPEVFLDWVRQGLHGGLKHLIKDPAARSDIRRWFPDSRSVVMLAFSYGGPAAEKGLPGSGIIARFGTLEDYHGEIRKRLKRLLTWFTREASPGSAGRFFVDTSPVLERFYARLAGIGWIGKNAMLLSQRLGSRLFLGGMAVDRELEHDRPVPDRCGTCRRCLDACPAAAFVSPRLLDAGRCVACLSIERRFDPVPKGLRESVGTRIFGCDACQDACPWNRFAAENAVFKPRLPSLMPLEEVLSLDAEAFRERFRRTPLMRAGFNALIRNALLAAGNSFSSPAVPCAPIARNGAAGNSFSSPAVPCAPIARNGAAGNSFSSPAVPEAGARKRLLELVERFTLHEDPMVAEQARWSLARLKRRI